MSMQDPLSDMLTRIRNAHHRSKPHVSMPASKLKASCRQGYCEEGYIGGFSVTDDVKPTMTVELKYLRRSSQLSKKLTRISKPVCDSTREAMHLPKVRSGLGIAIVSTRMV